MKSRLILSLIISLIVASFSQQQVITEYDYMRAERFLRWNTSKLVFKSSVRPVWLDNGRFWYKNQIPEGTEYILVDPERKNRLHAFDHAKLAKSLSAISDTTLSSFHIPISEFSYTEAMRKIQFKFQDTYYICDLNTYECIQTTVSEIKKDRYAIQSPDGKLSAFIREYNLWLKNIETGEESQLTYDGVADFGYATNNAGWRKSKRPVLLWSPDSKKIATFQHDARGVGEMHLISTKVGHPKLESWKYPLPEDTLIFRIERVIIHIDGPKIIRLNIPPDMHRSTITDHIADWSGNLLDAEWNESSTRFAFVSSTRDHKKATLRIADAQRGDVRDVMYEEVGTYFESGYRKVNWHVLNKTNDVIWFSERSDWGHLYLYDLYTGQLKSRITEGEWNVLQVLKIDENIGKVYFIGCGREDGDPYYHYLYSVNLDGTNLKLLTPENANHSITYAPSGDYFIDSYSTPVEPPVILVRDSKGHKIVDLEKADISQLVASGWIPPVPFKVKGRDGKTDIYGLMYKPTHFESHLSYPVLNYLYPGPQSGSIGTRGFRASRSDKQAVAELGFIVVEIDAMGTPQRSKSFHDAYYGNMGDNGIPDQIAAIKALGAKYSWMNLEKIGIWGSSGGGYASTRAILAYPEFYKVAVSASGNHDNRNYEDDWGEKWQGLLVTNEDGSSNYDNQANQLLAENLEGKLLLAHGMMDNNVPPSNTLLMVDALIKANKDFDMLMIPNKKHGLGIYMMRRRWDYFVRHLHNIEPPKEYEIKYNR